MQKTDINPTSYFAALPDESREPMQQIDRLITRIMEGQSRVVWEGPFWVAPSRPSSAMAT